MTIFCLHMGSGNKIVFAYKTAVSPSIGLGALIYSLDSAPANSTVLTQVPMPLRLTSTTSRSFSHTGGDLPIPTPSGLKTIVQLLIHTITRVHRVWLTFQ